ncbi:OsmC family peroxiredoxin [Halobacillus litoralis]|uniref:OsmC family peroxiredoxin n=1 Tax=Halobacillus litoralis TaxID=45668 RepID=A0A845DLZ0_9BACI|nr:MULTISPECIES: OsmC family protein [Halobacillus]MYL18510.1 OsmC family peroxiredoxin [Halobacillus litoralis]MYL30482.1 OsmC family peroxiredoxin [Halobacillus halophilus]MYL38850.1 OsmC family peroxiredoxin [Halobacillus litoralis]
MEFKVQWNGDMAFSGDTPSGHTVNMDAGEESGGKNGGARPTELLMNAVAGCTGIDIISILKKMRLPIEDFHMDVSGDRAEEHPRKFTTMHIHYDLKGDLPEEKVVRAIQLSKDKYCSVSHSVSAELTVSYSINGVQGTKTL